jgi:hypothetical protein
VWLRSLIVSQFRLSPLQLAFSNFYFAIFFFFSLLFYISHFFSLCRVCYLLFLHYISSDSFNGLLPVESVINNNNNNNLL